MKSYIFEDKRFIQPEGYNSQDIQKALSTRDINLSTISEKKLEQLDIDKTSILIFPYISGEFSELAFTKIIDFHKRGGSLFFLGDLPHIKKWYPFRNGQASDLHLTRCDDEFTLDKDSIYAPGLTKTGADIIESIPNFEQISEKSMAGLRVTAFPPDISTPLLAVKSQSHTTESSAVITVQRRCQKFLGSKLALIGFNGGEPRENVSGAYQLDWEYDRGLLNRDWSGINHIVTSIYKWLQPEQIAISINKPALSAISDKSEYFLEINIANLSDTNIKDGYVSVLYNTTSILNLTLDIKAKQRESIKVTIPYKHPCLSKIRASFEADTFIATDKTDAYIISHDIIPDDAFGFSTYWAFKNIKKTEEFKFFCTEMYKNGCRYLRANIPWEDIEPVPGQYDWSVVDKIIDTAESIGLKLQIWMFPTTRGSGLSDAGVPLWSLKEPAIDRDGNPGFFPSLWSPFYRKHYFNMIDTLTKRYSGHPQISKFVLDFGNSDFPYGYYYYGGDNTIFDYSEFEKKAFQKYLEKTLEWSIQQCNKNLQTEYTLFSEINIPFSEQKEAFSIYLNFREWSLHHGISKVNEIIRKNAPTQLPPDLPGHGTGSISDITSYFLEAKSKYWDEEQQYDKHLTSAHNSGSTWGGEPWQVGGDFRQYDDALFMSIRLNASYFSIPGCDLGIDGDSIAKIGYIRNSMAGAFRAQPKLAIFDNPDWFAHNSLAHIGSRLDIPVDLIYKKHWFDFSKYKLMIMPDSDHFKNIAEEENNKLLVPIEQEWYELLYKSVEKGLNVLIFPKTCCSPLTHLRTQFNLEDVKYRARKMRTVHCPDEFGGGTIKGKASSIICNGVPVLKDEYGESILVRIPVGKGSILLAGWDTASDSFDSMQLNCEETENLSGHTLQRLCKFYELDNHIINTDGLYAWKEILYKDNKIFMLIFSHYKQDIEQTIEVELPQQYTKAVDLATNEEYPLTLKNNKYSFTITLKTRQGRYLEFFS
jgi:hypothetical protein